MPCRAAPTRHGWTALDGATRSPELGVWSGAAMDLLEYQGKQLFARHGIPVPSGKPAATVEEAVAAAEEIGYPCVVKAQVLIGGRGKAGGIKVAQDREQARTHAEAILGMDIRGLTVHELWIEAASDIAAEYYASIVFDRSAKAPLVMLSTKGGMDIEQVAEEDPAAIAKLHVDPLLGFQDFHGRRLAFEAGVDADVVRPVGALLARLYAAFVAEEAMLVEVNPLIVTGGTAEGGRDVRALDAKVTLDGNALYRHPENAALRNPSAEDEQERMAKERGLTYVKLDGDIGILGNGAGLVMSTLDVVAQAGGKPANFLDAGGGSKADAIVSAVEVILSDAKVKAVLFNIFGGITRCDEVAKGLIEAFDVVKPQVPFVVRLDGTNDVAGRQLLADASLPNVHTESTMLGAAQRVVELAREAAGAPA
jgi:succinyl-CoA synthetase beta subunit